MEYRVIRTGQSDDHIEHALFGGGRQKGAQNKNHKYLARAWWQNKWRYAYTQAEVRMLQNLGKARETAKNVGDKAKAGAAKVTKTVSDVASGKYARDVDSRADRYAESAARRSAASKRQSASGREQQEMYRTANKVAEYNEEKAKKFTNKLTGKSKMYEEAATSDRNAAKTAAAEGSRLISMSRENSAAARSDAKKAAEAEAEKNTAAYKISKAAGNASRATREAADRVSDTARDVGNRVSNAARGAASKVSDVVRDYTDKKVLSGQYAREVDEDYNRSKEDYTKQRQTISDIVERNNKLHDEYNDAPYPERVSRFNDTLAKSINQIDAYERANKNANASSEKLADAIEKKQGGTYKVSKAIDNAQNTARKVTDKGKAAVERLLNRASNAAKAVGERATDTANRATDSIDRAVDKVKDAATTAARKAAAQSVKMEYGADSPQYRAAKAQVDYDKAVDDLSEARDKYGVNSSQYKQAMRNEAAAREEKNEALKAAKLDSRKSNSEKAKDRITSAASLASEKGKAAVERLFNRASDAARSAAEKVANSETGRKVSAAAERVADRVSDIKESAEHKAYASEMKRKYGADSLHYKDAQALLDHDKAVDDLAKARDKYGVNSSEYKAAMRKEQSTRDAMDEVHEQNLYTNNAQYKKISDQASALGSYIDNMDARGGPQTAEGKANYRKAVQDLERLEAQLERMWNEDWE